MEERCEHSHQPKNLSVRILHSKIITGRYYTLFFVIMTSSLKLTFHDRFEPVACVTTDEAILHDFLEIMKHSLH